MSESAAVSLHTILLETLELILMVSSEIRIYTNPTSCNEEFLDSEVASRQIILKNVQLSPHMTVKTMHEKVVEIKNFMDNLIKKQHSSSGMTYLTVSKRQRGFD